MGERISTGKFETLEVEDVFLNARGGTAFGREGSDGSKGSQGSKGKVGGSAASINKTFTTGLCP